MTAAGALASVVLLLGVEADADRVRELIEDDWRVAVVEAARLFDEHGDDSGARAAYGEALFRAGRLVEAERVLAPLQDTPEARGLVTLARLLEAGGDVGKAVELAAAAVELAPDDPHVLFWTAGLSESREASARRLERFVEVAAEDDVDRVDSARLAIDMYRTLGDRVVWETIERPDTVALPLRPLWDPAGGRLQGYLVRVGLGTKKRKPVWLLLDTGSPGLFVIERIARKHGFEPLAMQRSFGGGGDRKHTTQRGTFDQVSFGELRFRNALASVHDTELDPTGRFHGVVGLSAFSGYRVVLDLAGRTLRLEPAAAAPAPGESRYWSVEGQLLVPAQLDPGGAEALFLLDSGATGTLVARDWAARVDGARLGPAADVRGIGGSLGAVALSGVSARFLGQTVGPDGLRAVPLDVRSTMGGVEVAGFLGLDLLSGARLEIDTVTRQVAFEREPGRRRSSRRAE